jgi:hypothetical protein
MPSSNPTNGLGVPCYVHVSGINVQNSGNLTGGPTNRAIGATAGTPQGQGSGPQTGTAGQFKPVAQYALTLSLSGATYNGVAYAKSCGLVGSVVDVSGTVIPNSEYTLANFIWEAYQSFSKDTWYRPNAGTAGPNTYNGEVVSLGASYGTYDADVVVTANAVGQCVVECSYPTFDNSLGDNTGYNPEDEQPVMAIFAQIVVTVTA